jgi:hypothetical protein
MKVTITAASKPAVNFPCIMKLQGEAAIVLFDKPSSGTVIQASTNHPLGEYKTNWQMDNFTLFDGDVTLEN